MRALTQESGVKSREHFRTGVRTGVGKSFVASALAQKACRDRVIGILYASTALFRKFALAQGDAANFRRLVA